MSIIITAHNYGKYVCKALDSALNQNFNFPYEVVVVNDGSTDYTASILKKYESNDSVILLNLEGVGLAKACNAGIKASNGEYIIRLDADDWFDENILLNETTILDQRPEIGMVYPDYYIVDHYGSTIEHIRLQRVNDEVHLLDRSALAAGALYRRTCYDAIGGYNETLKYQEDYDFWLRFTELFNVYNINLPLMYYRRHNSSMSTNLKPRLESRRKVKHNFVKDKTSPEVIAIIPVKSEKWDNGNELALTELSGKPLIDYSISEALSTKSVSRVVVSTDSDSIAQHAVESGAEAPFLRPRRLTAPSSPLRETLLYTLNYLKREEQYIPDYVLQLQYISPLRKAEHIQESIDSMMIYNTDSVISVSLDKTFHWQPGKKGLEPIVWKNRLLRKDKHTVYRENGAIYLYALKTLYEKEWLGNSVGHIEMLPQESYRIFNKFDFWMCDQILTAKDEI